MNETESISPPELVQIREAAYKSEIAKHQATVAAKEYEIAQLRIAVRHGLRDGDNFDLATGAITRQSMPAKAEESSAVAPAQPSPEAEQRA